MRTNRVKLSLWARSTALTCGLQDFWTGKGTPSFKVLDLRAQVKLEEDGVSFLLGQGYPFPGAANQPDSTAISAVYIVAARPPSLPQHGITCCCERVQGKNTYGTSSLLRTEALGLLQMNHLEFITGEKCTLADLALLPVFLSGIFSLLACSAVAPAVFLSAQVKWQKHSTLSLPFDPTLNGQIQTNDLVESDTEPARIH